MKTFTYDMYQKQYLGMNPGCFYSESYDPDTKIEITIKTMKAIIDETESMIYWVKFPKFFLGIVVAMCVIEFFMVFMHRNEALSKQGYDKFYRKDGLQTPFTNHDFQTLRLKP